MTTYEQQLHAALAERDHWKRVCEETEDRAAVVRAQLQAANDLVNDDLIGELRHDLAEARLDGERLDWLLTGDGIAEVEVEEDHWRGVSTREELDAARAAKGDSDE